MGVAISLQGLCACGSDSQVPHWEWCWGICQDPSLRRLTLNCLIVYEYGATVDERHKFHSVSITLSSLFLFTHWQICIYLEVDPGTQKVGQMAKKKVAHYCLHHVGFPLLYKEDFTRGNSLTTSSAPVPTHLSSLAKKSTLPAHSVENTHHCGSQACIFI